MARALPAPPADLTERGRELWSALAIGHSSTFDAGDQLELRLVVDAILRLEGVRTALNVSGVAAVGSTGQPVAHPLIPVEASLRLEVAKRLQDWGGRW